MIPAPRRCVRLKYGLVQVAFLPDETATKAIVGSDFCDVSIAAHVTSSALVCAFCSVRHLQLYGVMTVFVRRRNRMKGVVMTRITLTLLSLALLTAPAAAAPIFFDDFEADAMALGIDTELVNWTVTAGNLDVVGPGTQWAPLCADSTQCLDMDGTPGANASITTKSTFDLAAGNYAFSFDYGNNRDDNNWLSWSLDGLSLGSTVLSDSGMDRTYTSVLQNFILDSAVNNVSITFTGGGPASYGGTVLDNVLLDFTPNVVGGVTTVPEPSSLLLLSMGLATVALRRFRR